MRIKQWYVKLSVLALAVFGAFAFTTQNSYRYLQQPTNPNTCTNITVGCSNSGDFLCKVITPDGVRNVWNDIMCTQQVFHNSPDALPAD